MFPLEQVEEHIAHCGSRTQLCELCEKYIKDKDYNEHVMHCEGKVYESELQDAPSEQYQGS